MQKKNWELANPSSIERPSHIQSEFYVDQPHYTSINQRREDEIRAARQRENLLDHTTDVKETYDKAPGLGFVQSPAVPSKNLLA